MSTSSYANCHFCGDIVKSRLANTYQCPTCIKKEKTCTKCGVTKPIHNGEKYMFAYNFSKDSLKFEDPFNDICQECQQAKATTVRSTKSELLRLSEGQLGVIEMVKAGCDNPTMAKRLQVKANTLRAMKSATNGKLKKYGMTFESYPNKVVAE